MPKSKFLVNGSELDSIKTNHTFGYKKVLFSNLELDNLLTQIAIGFLKEGDVIPNHCHDTMDEYFFILSGSGTFIIDGIELPVLQNNCIQIPSKHQHQIISKTDLSFFYFGISVD